MVKSGAGDGRVEAVKLHYRQHSIGVGGRVEAEMGGTPPVSVRVTLLTRDNETATFSAKGTERRLVLLTLREKKNHQ